MHEAPSGALGEVPAGNLVSPIAHKLAAIAVRSRIGNIAKESAGRRGVAVSGELPVTWAGRLNSSPKTLRHDTLTHRIDADPETSNEDLLTAFLMGTPEGIRPGLIRVSRKWVASTLPDTELLEAGTRLFQMLYQVAPFYWALPNFRARLPRGGVQ